MADHADTHHPSESSDRQSDLTPWRLIFHVSGEPATSFGFEIVHEITIGRADDEDNFMPDLDLIPYGAIEKGVSRQHAKMYSQNKNLYIIDLDSRNGTRVNGHLVESDKPENLHEGDQIEFGSLRVTLNIIRYPI
jgi:pSer/pThr/pTyr-binding forkhead associated (FHA) protein